MNNLNYCLKCTRTIKPKAYKRLSKSLIAIHKSNAKINPKLSKLIDQLLNQKYA